MPKNIYKNEIMIEKYEQAKNESEAKNRQFYWDYIILTVANRKQKKYAKKQLKSRKKMKSISPKTKCMIKIAPKNLGTGTMLYKTLKQMKENKKILYIPSAGKAQRTFYYFNKGKIWIPVNRKRENGENATILDEILINTYPILKKMQEGVLVACSDVIVLLGQEIDPLSPKKAYVFSTKEKVEKGTRHGVFQVKENKIKKIFQKQSQSILEKEALTEDKQIYIDTGMVLFPITFIKNLSKLKTIDKKMGIYEDILPLFVEKQKNETPELETILLTNGKFIHLGTSQDILEIKQDKEGLVKQLNWNQKTNGKIENDSYVENSEYVGTLNQNMILDSQIDQNIPPQTILYTAKINKRKWVTIICGLEDDLKAPPEKATLFHIKLSNFLLLKGKNLWKTKIYLPAKSPLEASRKALEIYKKIKRGELVENKKAMSIDQILKKEKIK